MFYDSLWVNWAFGIEITMSITLGVAVNTTRYESEGISMLYLYG